MRESSEPTAPSWFSWAPLLNFQSDLGLTKIGNGCTIRFIAEDELAFMNGPVGLGNAGPIALGLIGITHVLEFRPSPDTDPPDDGVVYQNPPVLWNCIRALRLALDGAVGHNWVGTSCLLEDGSYKPSIGSWSSHRLFTNEPYTLTPEAIPEVRALAKALLSLDNPALDRANDRFWFTYLRTSPADRLVDQWIALESLFVPDGTEGLTYKAAIRIAHFSGTSSNERLGLFKFVQKSYNRRSRVVHGDPIPDDIHEVATETHKILQNALKRLVLESPGFQPKQLAAQLDDRAARGVGDNT